MNEIRSSRSLLHKSSDVIPAEAGIQSYQCILDTALCPRPYPRLAGVMKVGRFAITSKVKKPETDSS